MMGWRSLVLLAALGGLAAADTVAAGAETIAGGASAATQRAAASAGRVLSIARGGVNSLLEHIEAYDAVYFVAGPMDPMARFQISLAYRFVSQDSAAAAAVPPIAGLRVAYTQTSLWDLNEESAPFYDTSYKPEVHWISNDLAPMLGGWAAHTDIQTGFQHESNGKSGADSRSINILYVRPSLIFGDLQGWHASASAKIFDYVTDLSDNPDIADYRGYVELRLRAGHAHGLLLSTEARRRSLLTEVSYPLGNVAAWFGYPRPDDFGFYLMAQHFIGYGESMLDYDQRSQAVRFGLAIVR
jgi:outer membrane phospholipase A